MAERLTGPLAPDPDRAAGRGFTVIEVLIALLVLLIGMGGILSLQFSSVNASGYARHATEASALAEGKMEELRTQPLSSVVDGADPDKLNARGELDPDAPFTREWKIALLPAPPTIEVAVSWLERGGEAHEIKLTTQRTR